MQNLTSVSESVGDQKLSPGSVSVYKTLLWQWYPSHTLWSPEELGEMFRRIESGISPIFQHRSHSKAGSQWFNDAAQTLWFWEWEIMLPTLTVTEVLELGSLGAALSSTRVSQLQ